MDYYTLEISGLTRELPVVALGPNIKIASFNLLGDAELVEKTAKELKKKLKKFRFDAIAGPEVKVVPLLHTLAKKLNHKRYVVGRKKIHGYMTNPQTLDKKPTLVFNGPDAKFLEDKKVVVVDDVVSTGRTLNVMENLVQQSGGEVVANAVVLKQGTKQIKNITNPIFLGKLPVFKT